MSSEKRYYNENNNIVSTSTLPTCDTVGVVYGEHLSVDILHSTRTFAHLRQGWSGPDKNHLQIYWGLSCLKIYNQ